MQTAVNSTTFTDARNVLGASIIVPRLQLHQLHFIGRIPVYLIRAHVDKHTIGSRVPSGLKHIKRTYRIDFEVNERKFASQVVRGLSCTVYY